MKASSLGLQEVRVNFGAFDCDVLCLVGPWEGAKKFVAWKLDDDRDELKQQTDYPNQPRGHYWFRSGYIPIMWIPKPPKTPREHATLAHEMLHLVRNVMEWAGIPLNRDTDEAYCHALGHGVATVLEALKK